MVKWFTKTFVSVSEWVGECECVAIKELSRPLAIYDVVKPYYIS